MEYKVTYQFKWLMVLILLLLVYASNLVLIRLPFVSIDFYSVYNLFPKISFQMQVYNIQTVVVWFCGIIFGYKIGFLTLCVYLFLGLAGFPVFAGGGGIDYYKEPTFGYLLSLPFNAYLSGYLFEKKKKIMAVFIPILITHICGIFYLVFLKNEWLDISWYLSFSMIGYDLIFSFLLTPLMPLISFFFREMFIQEIPVRESIVRRGRYHS